MKSSLLSVLSILLVMGAAAAQAETKALVVDQIEDGDTLVVTIDGAQERLQLLGIDAPEDVENAKLKRDMAVTGLDAETLLALGAKARLHLQGLVAVGQQIEASGDFEKRDRYGRIDVLVHTASAKASLNELMVADGYAMVLGSYPFKDDLKGRMEGLEEMAVATQRGLWAEGSRSAALAWSGRTVSAATGQ